MEQATTKEGLEDVTNSLDDLVGTIRQDGTRIEQIDSNQAVIHKKQLETESALTYLNTFVRIDMSEQMKALESKNQRLSEDFVEAKTRIDRSIATVQSDMKAAKVTHDSSMKNLNAMSAEMNKKLDETITEHSNNLEFQRNQTHSKITSLFEPLARDFSQMETRFSASLDEINQKFDELDDSVTWLDNFAQKSVTTLTAVVNDKNSEFSTKLQKIGQSQSKFGVDLVKLSENADSFEQQLIALRANLKSNSAMSDQLAASETRINEIIENLKTEMEDTMVKQSGIQSNLSGLHGAVENLSFSQEKLESDFVQYQFDVEDEISMSNLAMNETLLDMRAIMEQSFMEKIGETEGILIDQITKKMNTLKDNMKKFSDVSSLGANELRSLIESEILELQVKAEMWERGNFDKLIKLKML